MVKFSAGCYFNQENLEYFEEISGIPAMYNKDKEVKTEHIQKQAHCSKINNLNFTFYFKK